MNFTVFISCSVKAFPLPAYTWYKNVIPLPDQKTDVILIKAATKDDVGQYMCTVSNIKGMK